MLKLAFALLFSSIATHGWAISQGLKFHLASLKHEKAATFRGDGSLRIMQEGFFNQKLSHSDEGSATFKQRYFIDSKYASQTESAPVFYIICGEWNCGGTGSYSSIESLAREVGAHLVALEHRFYGESLPFTRATTERLGHLTLEEAITDLATFQKHAMENLNLKGKWVAFGGSYAGTLAAFYRLKHPELVVGALASSAPVLVKPEFNEYDAHVAEVINKTICGDQVREAVAQIESRLSTPERAQELKALFQSSSIVDDVDFLYVVADMLAAAVQYSRHTRFCQDLAQGEDRVVAYANAGLSVLRSMGTTPAEIALSVAESPDITPASYYRQWMWQSCREFGWFQVANGIGSDTSRSARIDLPYHIKACERFYGPIETADGSLNEIWYSPLFRPETTHIIFTNGSNDPWMKLSVIPGVEAPNLDVLMIDGAAHCNDLSAWSSLPTVMAAQIRFGEIIRGWLE